jgi:GntR family transcriptional regulator
MTNCAAPELALQGGVAICRQIQTQIRDLILQGRLRPGEELPTVRAMAVELAVNPEVVQRAYVELEREEIVTSKEGSGTFVTARRSSQWGRTESRGVFAELCSEFLAQAARYGFSSEDVIAEINLLSNRLPLT